VIEGWAAAVTDAKWPRLAAILKRRAADLTESFAKASEQLAQAVTQAYEKGFLPFPSLEGSMAQVVELVEKYKLRTLKAPSATVVEPEVRCALAVDAVTTDA
jgi:hypothetical protein